MRILKKKLNKIGQTWVNILLLFLAGRVTNENVDNGLVDYSGCGRDKYGN